LEAIGVKTIIYISVIFAVFVISCSQETVSITPTTMLFSTATLPVTVNPLITTQPPSTQKKLNTENNTIEVTPTIDIAKYTGPWKKYTSDEFGISFEYPEVFDNILECSVNIIQRESFGDLDLFGYAEWTEIRIGGENYRIDVVEIGKTTLADAIDQITASKLDGVFEITRLNMNVDDKDAIQIEYSSEYNFRYGVVTIFKNKNNLLATGQFAIIGRNKVKY